MKVTLAQAMKVTKRALSWAHDLGDCLFCELSGTDVHAWHEKHCPLRNIDPNFPPPKKSKTA